MPETLFNLYEAKSALSQLVERAAAGEEIIITKAGKPMAKLTGLSHRGRRRKPGGWKGRVVIAKNFDAPLLAIRAAFEDRTRARVYTEAVRGVRQEVRGKRVREALESLYGKGTAGLDTGLTDLQARALGEKW